MTGRLAILAVHIFFYCGSLAAAPKVAEGDSNLLDTARTEIQQAGKASTTSTNAQVTGGMLSLKDPLPPLHTRSWDYFLRVAVQSFRPQGSGSNDLASQRFNLGEVDSTVLPSLALGFELPLWSETEWHLRWGAEGRGAYTTEKGYARFNTGYVESDAHLNTTVLSVDPYLRFGLARWSRWSVLPGMEFGSVTYTQSSNNKLATFSERSSYVGYDLGLEFALTKSAGLAFNYARRTTAATAPARLPNDNYELGTRFSW
jgi:hypothetical protein